MSSASPIIIKEELCQGCNKCVRNCPIFGVNISYTLNGQNKVKIDSERCIHCGRCIEVCAHDARDYRDDTETFFMDLASNKKIAVMTAPSIRTNFPDYKRLLGWLKSLGVTVIFDVSFGADITTWAYLKVITENKLKSVIAQPCPAIVNYIQKFQTELLDF